MKITRAERGWLEHILETLVPPGVVESLSPSALDTDAVEIFEEMLRWLPAATSLGLRFSVIFIELMAPALVLRRAARFSGLSQDDRVECLTRMSKSDAYLFRQMVLLHKSVACFGWGGDARVKAGLGYDRPPRFVKRGSGA